MLRVYQLNVSVCRRRRGGYEFSRFVDLISFWKKNWSQRVSCKSSVMSDLLKMPGCTENAIDGQGFHVHHFVDVGGDGSVPVLLRSRIDPYHVRKMVVEFFQIVQRRDGRFFAKFDRTVWREQFMGDPCRHLRQKRPDTRENSL